MAAGLLRSEVRSASRQAQEAAAPLWGRRSATPGWGWQDGWIVVRPGVTAFVDVIAMQGDGTGNLAAASVLTSTFARPTLGSFTRTCASACSFRLSTTPIFILNGGNGYKSSARESRIPSDFFPPSSIWNHDGTLIWWATTLGCSSRLMSK